MANAGFNFDNTYLHLPKVFYTKLVPVPVPNPEMVILNMSLASEMGLNFSHLSENEQAILFSGNQMLGETESFAQAYAGHQFGHFTMLGDGRAIVWGEHITPSGRRLDLQFKGSGPTPYSRGGDGRAAIGPMLREYIISEAMHALNIPT
ncbi:MAG: protein adenylyltransferase SelO family protein, partial [Verrucomicrobiota bacterium]|nr:protein adenylyltransferase SelO family protein [Verrucomicrobiota bacterium]